MEQHDLKNISSCWNIKTIYYLETSGGQNSSLHLNVAHFLTPVLIRHLGSLTQLISYIGVYYVLFYYMAFILPNVSGACTIKLFTAVIYGIS